MEKITIKVDGIEYDVFVEECDDGSIKVHCGDDVYDVSTLDSVDDVFARRQASLGKAKEGTSHITAPIPGVITDVLVSAGDEVSKDAVLVKLIAMKMENEIHASFDGVVVNILVEKNQTVKRGDVLLVLEEKKK